MKIKGLYIFVCFDIVCLVLSILTKNIVNDNSVLYGKVIVIDPGHGGKDNGAEVDSVLEDEINLSISKHLYQKLFDKGAIVHITRTSDYDLAPENSINRKNKDLKKRTEFINTVDADCFISIHLNIYDSQSVNGVQLFYQGYKDESENLAKSIQKQFNQFINKKDKKAKLGDYYILNHTYPIGVIVECGFLSNSDERKKLTTNEYQNTIAEAVFKGINNYYK